MMFNIRLRVICKKMDLLARHLSVSDGRCFLYKNCIFSRRNYSSFELPRRVTVLVSSNFRYYAKSQDIKKNKQKQIKIDESELREYFDVEKLLTDFGKPLEYFKEELKRHATLRTSPNVIENVQINFEGDTYTVQDLAEIGKKNPRLYVLNFASFPEVIPTVITTFQKLELNLNVQQDGTKVFIPIPKVTKEYREVLAKKSKLYFNKCKESIRNVQMTYKKRLDNIEKLSTEEKYRIIDQLTALGDKQIHVAEEVLKAKHKELLQEDEVV